MVILVQIVEELLAAGAKLDPLVFDSYLLPLHMAINKVPSQSLLLLYYFCYLYYVCYLLLATFNHCTWPSIRYPYYLQLCV